MKALSSSWRQKHICVGVFRCSEPCMCLSVLNDDVMCAERVYWSSTLSSVSLTTQLMAPEGVSGSAGLLRVCVCLWESVSESLKNRFNVTSCPHVMLLLRRDESGAPWDWHTCHRDTSKQMLVQKWRPGPVWWISDSFWNEMHRIGSLSFFHLPAPFWSRVFDQLLKASCSPCSLSPAASSGWKRSSTCFHQTSCL